MDEHSCLRTAWLFFLSFMFKELLIETHKSILVMLWSSFATLLSRLCNATLREKRACSSLCHFHAIASFSFFLMLLFSCRTGLAFTSLVVHFHSLTPGIASLFLFVSPLRLLSSFFVFS